MKFFVFLRIVWKIISEFLFDKPPPISKNKALDESLNFGPVHEEITADNLKVIGKIPEALDGMYVRNGPNPQFTPTGRYHWFDGDGMLHGVRIENGKARYLNRWVRTIRFLEEKKAGKPLLSKLGDIMSPAGFKAILMSQFKRAFYKLTGKGTANTSVEFHDGRFLALVEADHPYHVKLPEIETIGRYSFNGDLKEDEPFTAHPKVDAVTGEMMFFGYRFMIAPYVTYHVVSKEGKLIRSVPIHTDVATMMHDFAITEHYSIIMDFPLTFRKERMLDGSVLMFEHDRPTRFGILPRHAQSDAEVKWFEAPACYVYHVMNAWEEGDEVVLFACRQGCAGLFGCSKKCEEITPYPFQWRFNMKTGEVTQKQFDTTAAEFPRIREELIGRKTEFVYMGGLEESVYELPRMNRVLKYNLSTGEKKEILLPKGKFAGEWVFIPKPNESKEDAGYLTCFVFDEVTKKSELWILDAQSFDPNPVARIEIPQRVPFGFHGKWISAAQLASQRC